VGEHGDSGGRPAHRARDALRHRVTGNLGLRARRPRSTTSTSRGSTRMSASTSRSR
jgi:hypothetical protein